jgi:hypothetical protein
MKRLLSSVAAFLCLVLTTNAIPQTYDIPSSIPEYRVSFDMNTSEELNITINPTEYNSTSPDPLGLLSKGTAYSVDSIYVKGRNGAARIEIVFYVSLFGMDISDIKEKMIDGLFRGSDIRCERGEPESYVIDGIKGNLVTGINCRDLNCSPSIRFSVDPYRVILDLTSRI